MNLERTDTIKAIQPKLRVLVPRWNGLRDSAPAIGRASVIGFIFGVIPGVSHVVSTFVSYAVEKRFSRHPEEFGHGAIEGVAGPEAANNASTAGVLVPLLTLGVPSSATAAILLAAFQQYGLQPGPLLFSTRPDLVWTLIASLLIGNVMLLVLNLPLVSIWARVMLLPRPLLFGFKSTYGYVPPAAMAELGLPGPGYWHPAITDHYRFALTPPQMDGLLIALRTPAEVAALAAALEQGPLTEEEEAYLMDVAGVACGEARVVPDR